MIAPDVEIIDITHGIQPHGVLQGALVLANTLPYMPTGVHLAVVDPGVGGGRRRARAARRRRPVFVGPDNGLLVPAAEKLGGIEAAHEITNAGATMLDHVSATFHGRDVFAPAAAHLVERGRARRPRPDDRARVARPARAARAGRDAPRGSAPPCLYVDRFGNMQLNLTREDLERARARAGHPRRARDRVGALLRGRPRGRSRMRRDGEIIVYEDAYENIAIAISGGSAAAHVLLRAAGRRVRIRVAD
mgnify:CR=1 FL=1